MISPAFFQLFKIPIFSEENAIPGFQSLVLSTQIRYDEYDEEGPNGRDDNDNPIIIQTNYDAVTTRFGLSWRPADDVQLKAELGVVKSQLIELMSWFPQREDVDLWSGPGFRYPFDLSSFKSDLRLDSLNSFALISAEGKMLAFGQYYLRLGKCHLGRLVVNPSCRGQGIAASLISELSSKGMSDLKTDVCSLFALEDNRSAIRAYTKLGFIEAEYPEKMPLKNCVYMVNLDIT